MRVIVTGGREYENLAAVEREIDKLNEPTIVQGGAFGADALARKVAYQRGLECISFPADWTEGRKAGPLRNQRMVDCGADLVLAFSGGRGTADCIRRARKAGIPVKIIDEGEV